MTKKRILLFFGGFLLVLGNQAQAVFTYEVQNATPFTIDVQPDIDGVPNSSFEHLTGIKPGESRQFQGVAANLLRRVNATINESWRGKTVFGNMLIANDAQRQPGRGTTVQVRGYDASTWGVTGSQKFVVSGPLFNNAGSSEDSGKAGLREPYYVITRLID